RRTRRPAAPPWGAGARSCPGAGGWPCGAAGPGCPGPGLRLPPRTAAAGRRRGLAHPRTRRHLPAPGGGYAFEGLRFGTRDAARCPGHGRRAAVSVVLVMAKSPVAGSAKTRLCPPATPAQAARVAAAALLDTLAAVTAVDATPL